MLTRLLTRRGFVSGFVLSVGGDALCVLDPVRPAVGGVGLVGAGKDKTGP
ncbi:TPA: hypothetical protein ACIBS5_005297 [Salmonella enterica subsp. diarizonae serovar 60-67:z35:-]